MTPVDFLYHDSLGSLGMLQSSGGCTCREQWGGLWAHPVLMAVLCDIHHHCLFPAEEEVPSACSCSHGDAQVPVVGHEDQHEEVADHHLDDVQHSLQQVRQAQHLLAGNTNPNKSANTAHVGNAQPQEEAARTVRWAWDGREGDTSLGRDSGVQLAPGAVVLLTEQSKHRACCEDTASS